MRKAGGFYEICVSFPTKPPLSRYARDWETLEAL